VFEDYLHTGAGGYAAHVARTEKLMALFHEKPLDAESLAIFSGLRRAYLETSFAALEADWGTLDQYLAAAANLDAGRRQLLQSLLLET
jgi:Tyrosine phosphatase family